MPKPCNSKELAKAIDLLPYNQAVVLSLFYTEMLDFMQIGEVLGIPPAKAKDIYDAALASVNVLNQSKENRK